MIVMMSLDGLEIPMEWRPFLAKPMQEWADFAARDGVLHPEPEEQQAA